MILYDIDSYCHYKCILMPYVRAIRKDSSRFCGFGLRRLTPSEMQKKSLKKESKEKRPERQGGAVHFE